MKKIFTLQYLNYSVLIFLTFVSFQSFAQPSNDNPCSATPLTVNPGCSFVASTTVGATATPTAGIPAPGCASYGGPDVWFTVVVPASGTVKLDTQTGSITDGGMAIYSGSCTSMTLIECDDDDSQNGLMPMINLTGQTPGATLYVRFWKYSSGTGTFSICASSPPPPQPAPPCGNSPMAGEACSSATPICDLSGYCGNTSSSYSVSSWTSLSSAFCGSLDNDSFLSFTAAASSVSLNLWVTSSTMGYGIQLFIFSANTCGSGPVSTYGACYNPGVVEQNVTITATGLTPGNVYYILIDGYAGDNCNYVFSASSSGSGVAIPVSVVPANASICVGESVSLTASGGNGTYTWNASADLNTTSGANVTATPPAAGTYNYTVNSSMGNPLCPSSTASTATITVNPCGCNVVAGNSGPACGGASTVNLTASTVVNGTYSWTGPNGFTSTDQNPMNVPIPTTPGSYNFTVSVDDGITVCTSTTTVVVSASPVVNAGSDQIVCSGASVTLSGSGAQTYVWNNSVSNGVAFSATSTQTYTVTGTDANGCTGTDQVTVTVNPMPVIDAGAAQAICAGDSVVLNGTGGVSYTWNNGVTNGVYFSPAATQTYTVTGMDANGCTGTDQVVVTVNAAPAVNAGQDQNICVGGSVILTASGAATYVWNNGVTNGVSFTPSVTQTYTVTGTSASGCTNTDQVVVTVNQLPAVNAGADQNVCVGGSVTLTGSGAVSYTWNNGVANGISFVPSSTQTYTVTGTDANGCINTDQVIVTVNQLPIVGAGSNQTICVGMPVTLTGSGAQTYTWDNGVTNNVAFAPAGTQTYTVTGTDANGCQNTSMVTITVVPAATASLSSDVTSGTPVLEVEFSNNSTNASTYSFDFGNGQFFQTTNLAYQPVINYDLAGVYTVILTAGNGICSDTASVLITVFHNPLLVIAPNIFTPDGDGVNDEFFITLENASALDVMIVNRWGNKVASYSGITGSWDGRVNGNLAQEGVYFYEYVATGLDGTTQKGQGNIQLLRK